MMITRRAPKSFRTEDLRATERRIFVEVMAAYHDMKSAIGDSPAFNYAKVTGGRGAQYSDPGVGFGHIDYTVDVENAAKKALEPEEYKYFKSVVCERDIEEQLTRQSVDFLRIQEKLGRVFRGHGLFPIRNYFRSVKK